MLAKDTVIDGVRLADLVAMDNAAGPQDKMGRRGDEKRKAALLQAQAEISFKAGQQSGSFVEGIAVGRKEVVEWFMANQFDREHWENGSGDCSEGCPACRLDRQLKGWGVEK